MKSILALIIIILIIPADISYGTTFSPLGSKNENLRVKLMAKEGQKRLRDTITRMAETSFSDLAPYGQIQCIQREPSLARRIKLIMEPSSFLRHRCMTESQFNQLENALDEIQIGQSKQIENRADYGTLVNIIIANGILHLNIASQQNIDMPLDKRLRALSQSAKRIIYKLTTGAARASFVSKEQLKQFIKQAWDAENQCIDLEVKMFLFVVSEYLFRTKKDFGMAGGSLYRPIRGRASTDQIAALNKAVARSVDEIESLINSMPIEAVAELANNNADAKRQTSERLRKGLRLPKQISTQEQQEEIRLMQQVRFNVANALRDLWLQGYVPYAKWLLKNHPDIYCLALQKDVFGGDIKTAYEAAGLPLGIVVREEKGSAFRQFKGQLEQRFGEEIVKHADLRIEVVNEKNSILVLAGLQAFGGNWVRAVKETTGKNVSMPLLPDITPDTIERVVSAAGIIVKSVGVSNRVARSKYLKASI